MPADFFDTNVIVYLASADAAKADRAERLIAGGGRTSVQVLTEAANVARRKMRLSWDETHAFLSAIRSVLQIEPITLDDHDTGLAAAERYGLSIYDAMVVATALRSGCRRLWSEDMQDGLVIERRLTIANPFRRG